MGSTTLDMTPVPEQRGELRPRVLVVVPAYNEAQSITAVLHEIRGALPGVDVVVVDDGSEDGTAEVCRREAVACLVLPFNLGVGGAMRAGFRYARERGFDAVVQIDGDGQHDAAFAPALIGELGRGADVVVGTRFSASGTYRASSSRRLAMTLVAKLLSRACDVRLTDATSGFRAAGASAIDLFADTYPAEYFGDTLQSLIVAKRAGMVIREMPVEMRPRSAGRPSQGVASSARYLVRSAFAIAIGKQTRPERIWRRVRQAGR